MMPTHFTTRWHAMICWLALGAAAQPAIGADPKNIETLSQHFDGPDGKMGEWIFTPETNVKSISTSEHPGLAMIHEAGKGQDIKGILKNPIRIDEYRVPWEFQLCIPQSFNAMLGINTTGQSNFAYGLNVAVTFSDPSTWPKDRNTPPADLRSIQLLVAHVGDYGENPKGTGLPQYSTDIVPEKYMVWGRGTMGQGSALGDWEIPTIWCGDGARYGGPASNQLYFRCVLKSSTLLHVGIKFDASHGWNMRDIDLSRFGSITGIWEIGPIISCDNWIPDVLCASLPVKRGVNLLMPGLRDLKDVRKLGAEVPLPIPRPPNPNYDYYVDYCVFFNSWPWPFEDYSDEFNIPGYMGKWQIQPQSTLVDTYSYPGRLQLTMIGPTCGTGIGPLEGAPLDLAVYPPPWEIEICFNSPDDTVPWNFWMNWQIRDRDDRPISSWAPGVMNDPEEGRHKLWPTPFKLEFDDTLTEEILAAKPLYMLIQVIDATRVRQGFRADPNKPWVMSKIYDASETLGGKEMAILWQHCWSTVNGPVWGGQSGAPAYQKILIDYVRYRKGLTKE